MLERSSFVLVHNVVGSTLCVESKEKDTKIDFLYAIISRKRACHIKDIINMWVCVYIQVFLPCTRLTILGAAGGNILASRSCKTRLAFVVVEQVYVVLRAFIKVHSTWATRKKYVKILCYNMKASCFINKPREGQFISLDKYLSFFFYFFVHLNIINPFSDIVIFLSLQIKNSIFKARLDFRY